MNRVSPLIILASFDLGASSLALADQQAPRPRPPAAAAPPSPSTTAGILLAPRAVKRRTKNAKAFHDKCENTLLSFLIEVKHPPRRTDKA
ncbi:hypothetical protein P4132_12090, partial [Pseudomonas aeruginosa]|nr:hypothetical protein [Pseudomonas aeruginosa]